MNEDEFDEDGTFTVNLDRIIASKEMLAVTKLTAAKAKMEGYITVGAFLQQLSDPDLNELMFICEAGMDDTNERLGEVLLIAEILAVGEGIEPGTLSQVTQRMNTFIVMLTIESLYRKGLVKVYHNNMSLGEDAGDKIIVEKI